MVPLLSGMASPLELLARVPLFEELGSDDLRWIADFTEVRSYAAGENILEIGEAGRSLFILTSGTVQVLHPLEPESHQLARLGPGDFLGEMALLNDAPRSATVKAAGAVEALVLSRTEFRRLLLERPEVTVKLLEAMADRMRNADEQISDLGGEAVQDRLTGLRNKRAFYARLEEETARTRRYGGCFSLILIDLDHLAQVNEAHGHEVGDRVIAWVGRLLNEHTRASDVPFRFEEDAFTVICPGTSADAADRVAERLISLVADAKPPVEQDVTISVAASCATCPDHAEGGLELFQHAEHGLATRGGG
jgi:CRP/FNR family cyclic AMP-dependent transcriptional regulator